MAQLSELGTSFKTHPRAERDAVRAHLNTLQCLHVGSLCSPLGSSFFRREKMGQAVPSWTAATGRRIPCSLGKDRKGHTPALFLLALRSISGVDQAQGIQLKEKA